MKIHDIKKERNMLNFQFQKGTFKIIGHLVHTQSRFTYD